MINGREWPTWLSGQTSSSPPPSSPPPLGNTKITTIYRAIIAEKVLMTSRERSTTKDKRRNHNKTGRRLETQCNQYAYL